MGALLDYFRAHGVELLTAGDANIRARGPLTDELRAAIRAHKPAIVAELASTTAPAADPAVERRRARALAMLNNESAWQIGVVAEAGEPAHVTIAARGVAVGELEVRGYGGLALLALLEQHGHA